MGKFIQPREWLVDRLSRNLQSATEFTDIRRILVIGGGPKEPELILFDEKIVSVHFAGIDNVEIGGKFSPLDLNTMKNLQESFDLVICNQVLEHLYNLGSAFKNFQNLVRPGGFIWINCPASNYRHGSPEFYSAGYSWEFLVRNMESCDFLSIDAGELSSKRIYLYRHLLQIWPTSRQIKYPFISYFGIEGKVINKLFFNLRTIPYRIIISLVNRHWSINGSYAIETFGFFKKVD